MDNKVIVEVYFSGRNFSAHVPILPGCIATGGTPKQLIEQMQTAVDMHVKSSLEDGDEIPGIFKDGYELVFKYDTEGLLNYYKGVFTKTALYRLTGINSKQLHHYASGSKKPRRAQIEKLENAFHELGRELIEVKL
jgi:predicted RNase H-like HicB family nuclease